jgi:predicted  nucleic acid-binding Zn-ribbon protein
MNENLSVRMEKLETKVEAIGHDMTEVKNGVKQLTDALSGDGMRQGVIHSLTSQIEANRKAISENQAEQTRNVHEINFSIQRLHAGMFTQDETKEIRQVVSWFKGWKLVLVSLIPLIPLAISLINYFKP